MNTKNIRLSILNQSYLKVGGTAKQAISETIALAQVAERLGYTRYWVSEHHNILAIASSAPEIIVAHLAAHTEKIRVGAGGVMLTNHSALKVSENFRLLELLYPGRIDLGIGRTSGTDAKTAELLNPIVKPTNEDFIVKLEALVNYLHDKPQKNEENISTYAVPKIDTTPPIWMLSSGGQSSESAATLGTGLAVTHLMTADNLAPIQSYRDNFRPSAEMPNPEVIVGAFVFCSEDQDVLFRYRALLDYHFLQLFKSGMPTPTTFDAIKDFTYTAEENEKLNVIRQRIFIGTPDEIEPKLNKLLQDYQATELMMLAFNDTFEEGVRSIELLADLFLKVN